MTDKEKYHHTSLVGPSILIGIGIILLLENLGYVEWDFWQIFRLWPVLLIVWGLEILLQGRLLGRVLTALIVLIGIIGGIWFMTSSSELRTATSIVYPREDTSSFVLSLQPKVGSVSVGALTDSSSLIEGDISVPKGIRLVEDFSSGNRSRLRLDTLPSSRRWWPGQHESWDLNLDSDTLLDITVDQGIGDIDLDLSELNVNKANTDFAIASTKIFLPSSGNYDLHIDGGIGSIILAVPYDMAVHIEVDGGIITRSFPPGFRQTDHVWISPEYDESENKANITVSLGIGTLHVKTVAGP
jgi:hypothetical protein